MNTNDMVAPFWRTASMRELAGTSSLELAELEEYLDLCKVSRVRVLAFRFFAETVMGFVAGRLVTTLVLVVLLTAVASSVL